MFTGLIEELGTVSSIQRGANSFSIKIFGKEILSDIHIGDSISTNGVCLTVTCFDADSFTADVMPETFKVTNLKSFDKGDLLNLERAMKLGDRFGGHMVSGHIDGVGTIESILKDENAIRIKIKTDNELMRYMIKKGSIALDGISLTIAHVWEESFEVSIIPETAKVTTLGHKKRGDILNLECDIVGKYIERLMLGKSYKKDKVTEQLLSENGFL